MGDAQPGGVALQSAVGRLVVATTVLGSAVAMLTATVVNIALPRMATDLGADTASQQWIVNAYLLTLAALILIGGALGDRFGRVRIYRLGVALFAIASVGCAVAGSVEALIGFRLLQGVGGALLTPGSLAILESVMRPADRGEAVGLWSGLGGLAAAAGPLLGGVLVELSWRWVFLLNLPIAVAVLVLSSRVPESRDPRARDTPLDVPGAVLTAVGLGGISFALIEGSQDGLSTLEAGILAVALLALGALGVVERRATGALIPMDLFRNRAFVGANLVTLLLYSGLGVVFLLLSIQLQVTAGWSPLEAGASLLPVTLMILLLSSRAGRLAQQVGPRAPLTVGPLLMAGGMVLMTRIGADATFIAHVLPATVLFGAGLAVSVAPVTSAALSSVPTERVGAAAGTNNALARTGQLLAVAAIPPLAGLSGEALSDPARLASGFPVALLWSAGLVAGAGVIAFLLLESKVATQPTRVPAQCPLDGPQHHGT